MVFGVVDVEFSLDEEDKSMRSILLPVTSADWDLLLILFKGVS